MRDLNAIINQIIHEYETLRDASAEARTAHAAYLQQLQADEQRQLTRAASDYQRVMSEAQARKTQRLAQLDQQWQAKQASIRRDVWQTTNALGFIGADWNAPSWNQFALSNGAVPTGTRVGVFKINAPFKLPAIPALAPLLGKKHLVIAFQGALADAANQLLQSTALRLAATFPAGAFRFAFIDADGMGNNLRAFLTLPELVRGGAIVWEERHIEEELLRIAKHIGNVNQTRLSANFNTIEEYNAKVNDVSVPYQFVVIANFPTHFNDRAADALLGIAQNGPKAGVYILMTVDLDKKQPHNFDWNTLHNYSTVIQAQREDEFSWSDPEFASAPILPDRMPAPELTKTILELAGKAAEQQDNAGLKFNTIVTPQPWWRDSTQDFIAAPLGYNDKGDKHEFRIGLDLEAVHHALVGGQTGSGKTNMLHVLITNLALKYSPQELELYLVDFKEGVEFQDYARFNLPHARAVAIETEREFGVSILHRLQREMEQRGKLFSAAGVQNLKTYRVQTSKPLPRVLLIMDEYQALFKEDDRLAQEAGMILEDLVKRGRSFGIHILLSTQEPPRTFANGRAVYGQMRLRLCFQCLPDFARMILGDDNDAAKSLERPGEMFYNEDNGKPDKNIFVRVAYLPPAERVTILQNIQQLTQQNSFARVEPMAVFQGAEPARALDNAVLRQYVWSPNYQPVSARAYAPLGEAIEIKPHTAAELERQGRSNLLVIGAEESYARGMFVGALLGLAAQRSPQDAIFYILDFGKADVDPTNTLAQLKTILPHRFENESTQNAAQVVKRLDKVVTKRAAQSGFPVPEIFLIIFGAHRWRELRSSDPYLQTDLSKQLTHIAQEGPEIGVHLLAWLDSLANFERAFRRQGLEFFDLRVAMLMPQNDAMNFLENPAASKLSPNRAVFRSQEWEAGRLEKFKPYALPDAATLEQIKKRFARKS
ncbi:MAG: hypothetical protein B6D41_22180 [Chloroflexi bacterium UTCFX4]|jgi:hypothetical protein|nr:MAG: hypothetical protein B6D41_22180 [Chloroflexi bacterium UTCFX4]